MPFDSEETNAQLFIPMDSANPPTPEIRWKRGKPLGDLLIDDVPYGFERSGGRLIVNHCSMGTIYIDEETLEIVG